MPPQIPQSFFTAAIPQKPGEEYIPNLTDTPGHMDFNYEVSRSLAACDVAILVDAVQGIQPQTLANVYLPLNHAQDVKPSAMPEKSNTTYNR